MKHACGRCNRIFTSEELYLKHHCPQKSQSEGTKLSESEILSAVIASRKNKKP